MLAFFEVLDARENRLEHFAERARDRGVNGTRRVVIERKQIAVDSEFHRADDHAGVDVKEQIGRLVPLKFERIVRNGIRGDFVELFTVLFCRNRADVERNFFGVVGN